MSGLRRTEDHQRPGRRFNGVENGEEGLPRDRGVTPAGEVRIVVNEMGSDLASGRHDTREEENEAQLMWWMAADDVVYTVKWPGVDEAAYLCRGR